MDVVRRWSKSRCQGSRRKAKSTSKYIKTRFCHSSLANLLLSQTSNLKQRKRAARTTTADIISPINATFPGHSQGRSSTPGTPLLPVPPPTRGFPPGANTARRGTAPPGQGGSGGGSGIQGVHPFARHGPATGAGPGGRPFTQSSKQRPASMEVQGSGGGRKGLPNRSASPMPLSAVASPGGPGGGGGKGGGTLPSASVSASKSGQRQFPPNRNKRPGSADVQSAQMKKSKGESRSASPMPGAGVGQGQLRR